MLSYTNRLLNTQNTTMKIFILFFAYILLSLHALAAFPAKASIRSDKGAVVTSSKKAAAIHSSHALTQRVQRIAAQCSAPFGRIVHIPYNNDDANGTLSLIFALTGLIFPPLLIPSIILGIVGVCNHEQCALSGLIVSSIWLAILVFVIILITG